MRHDRRRPRDQPLMHPPSRRADGRGRLLFAVLLVLIAAAAVFGYRDYRRFAESPLQPLSEAVTIDVALGTPLPGIVRLVEQRGIRTGNPWYWRLLARELGVAGKLRAGEYALAPGLTPADLLRKMASGEVVEHHFTIVEGWTFKQLRAALAQDPVLLHTLDATSDADLMRSLQAPGALAEGWFLPETYSFVKGMSDADILRRAHEDMRRLLDKLWPQRPADCPLDSPYQLLTLA